MDIESETIDITPIFWPLVTNIATLPYEQLEKTQVFQQMCDYIDEDHRYTLTISPDTTLLFDNANELFYHTLHFFKIRVSNSNTSNMNIQEMYNILLQSVKIMETYAQTDELANLFQKL
jgi:acyl-coenzyme A synthetase/AMP-(fatty) acid ligase